MSVHSIQGFQAAETAEELLMDVAARIQLSPTRHDQAVAHYQALCEYVDGQAARSEPRLDLLPEREFRIGAVIASKVRTQQHDVDVVVELDLPAATMPAIVLGMLFNAIRGDVGSRYYTKTTLNSRCVTVRYDDGVTVDLMPIVRDLSGIERSGLLFHSKGGESYTKAVNPYGFKTLYNDTVEEDPSFVRAFRDSRGVALVEKALVEPMDDHVQLEEKSPRTVAIQLLKRFRDMRFRRADHDGVRPPPSVVLAAYGLNKPNAQPSLLAELADLVDTILRDLKNHADVDQMVQVRNPAYRPDVFTDRWPGTIQAQGLFASDLAYLADRLNQLARASFAPEQTKQLLMDLFGETAADYAIASFLEHRSHDADQGRLKFGATGTLLTGAAALTSTRVAARPSTDFGEDHP